MLWRKYSAATNLAGVRFLTTLIIILTVIPCLRAQKKEISQARDYLKSGENLDKAASLMQGLIEKDTANRKNTKIYEIWFDAVRMQYDQGNEKLYLKQQYDTAQLYVFTKTMFDIVFELDSVVEKYQELKPDDKKRRKYAELLNKYRRNLFLGGTHYMRKEDFGQAFTFYDAYVASAGKPILASYDYAHNDPRTIEAAFWATACAHKTNDHMGIFRHAKMAEEINDTTKKLLTKRFEAEAYLSLNDSLEYLAALKEGFNIDPKYKYNFPRLLDYYTDHQMADSALNLSDKALEASPDEPLFLYAKSTVLLNMGRNDECIAISDKLISICDTIAAPYYNVATATLNKAVIIEQSPQKDKQDLNKLYTTALPYMERYRQLAPDDKERWAPALYRIYLNLNMGKQFEEIDRIMKTL